LSVAKLALNPGNDQAELRFSTQPLKQSGSRITTGPVPLKIDGKLVRYLSVAASPDQELTGRIKLPPLAPGEHQIELGGSKIQHISPAGAVEK
ncbi:MAG: hypothetical protein ACRDBP_03580, partial [Luteolibacter sp.]